MHPKLKHTLSAELRKSDFYYCYGGFEKVDIPRKHDE